MGEGAAPEPLRPGGRPALPEPLTPEGRAGLAQLLKVPERALVGMDFDGTLSPIVTDPARAYAAAGAARALRRLSPLVGTLAVITGRPAALAADLGGFEEVPGLIVLGHYGLERWENGQVASAPAPDGVAQAREALPAVLAAAGAPDGTLVEDKGLSVAVHTREAPDPQEALDRLRGPLTALAARAGLAVEPGRLVIELRPRGMDKGAALENLASERNPSALMYCGDDLGDLAAFGAVRALRAAGIPGLTVCSGSPEVTALAQAADLVVDGPEGVVALLSALADALTP